MFKNFCASILSGCSKWKLKSPRIKTSSLYVARMPSCLQIPYKTTKRHYLCDKQPVQWLTWSLSLFSLVVKVNFSGIIWKVELKATATPLWLESRVFTDSGSLGLAFSKIPRPRLHSLLTLIDSGSCHVSAMNITFILWSSINSNTSFILFFSDLTFWNPIKTGDPVFWAWWRLETSGICSWRFSLCVAHLFLTFLPAFFTQKNIYHLNEKTVNKCF